MQRAHIHPRRSSRASRAGFTLVELLVAVAVGSFAIAVAGAMARYTVRSSGQNQEETDMTGRARMVNHQIRMDLSVAGLNSSGAIGVQSTVGPWGPAPAMFQTTADGGFPAISAVGGANNVAAGPFGMAPGTDAITIVVPDPATTVSTVQPIARGTTVLTVDQNFAGIAPPPPGCPFVYISDASASNGAGRTQIAARGPIGPTTIGLGPGEQTQMEIAPGSTVMCARVSTYFVIEPVAGQTHSRWLVESRLRPGVAAVPVAVGQNAFVDPSPAQLFEVAPGVVDMQIAYRMSTELAAVPRPTADPLDAWAFDDVPPRGIGTSAQLLADRARAYFEVRQIRVSMMAATLRGLEGNNLTAPIELMEDRVPGTEPLLSNVYRSRRIVTSETLVNLRYFDSNLPEGVGAEPY